MSDTEDRTVENFLYTGVYYRRVEAKNEALEYGDKTMEYKKCVGGGSECSITEVPMINFIPARGVRVRNV